MPIVLASAFVLMMIAVALLAGNMGFRDGVWLCANHPTEAICMKARDE